jgi:hypothetical protein
MLGLAVIAVNSEIFTDSGISSPFQGYLNEKIIFNCFQALDKPESQTVYELGNWGDN